MVVEGRCLENQEEVRHRKISSDSEATFTKPVGPVGGH